MKISTYTHSFIFFILLLLFTNLHSWGQIPNDLTGTWYFKKDYNGQSNKISLQENAMYIEDIQKFAYRENSLFSDGAKATPQKSNRYDKDKTTKYIFQKAQNLSSGTQIYIFKTLDSLDYPYAMLMHYKSFGNHHRMSLFTDLEDERNEPYIIHALQKEIELVYREEDYQKWDQLDRLEAMDEKQYRAWWDAYLKYLKKPDLQKELAKSPLGHYLGVDLQDPLFQEINQDILLSWSKNPVDISYSFEDIFRQNGISEELRHKLRGEVPVPSQSEYTYLYDTWVSRQVRLSGSPQKTLDFQFQLEIKATGIKIQYETLLDTRFLEGRPQNYSKNPQKIELKLDIQNIIPGRDEKQGMLIVGPFESLNQRFVDRKGKYSVVPFQYLEDGKMMISFGRFYDTQQEAENSDMLTTLKRREQGIYTSKSYLDKHPNWTIRSFTADEAESLIDQTIKELTSKGVTVLGLPSWVPSINEERSLPAAYLIQYFESNQNFPLSSISNLFSAYLLPFYKEQYVAEEITELSSEAEGQYLLQRIKQVFFREKIKHYEGKASLPEPSLQKKRQELYDFYESFITISSFEKRIKKNEENNYIKNLIDELDQIQKSIEQADEEEKARLKEKEKEVIIDLCETINYETFNLTQEQKGLKSLLSQLSIPASIGETWLPDLKKRIPNYLKKTAALDTIYSEEIEKLQSLQKQHCK